MPRTMILVVMIACFARQGTAQEGENFCGTCKDDGWVKCEEKRCKKTVCDLEMEHVCVEIYSLACCRGQRQVPCTWCDKGSSKFGLGKLTADINTANEPVQGAETGELAKLCWDGLTYVLEVADCPPPTEGPTEEPSSGGPAIAAIVCVFLLIAGGGLGFLHYKKQQLQKRQSRIARSNKDGGVELAALGNDYSNDRESGTYDVKDTVPEIDVEEY